MKDTSCSKLLKHNDCEKELLTLDTAKTLVDTSLTSHIVLLKFSARKVLKKKKVFQKLHDLVNQNSKQQMFLIMIVRMLSHTYDFFLPKHLSFRLSGLVGRKYLCTTLLKKSISFYQLSFKYLFLSYALSICQDKIIFSKDEKFMIACEIYEK